MNAEQALKALEAAKNSAKSAQDASAKALTAISRFYEIIGEGTVDDLRSQWAQKQNMSTQTLFSKICFSIGVTDDTHEKEITLSEPTESFRRPSWSIGLNREEAIELAHTLLKECGVVHE